jgi:hypothetical protein
MIPTYVLNAKEPAIVVITRELDADRVEIMWVVALNEARVGTLDWSFRSNLEDDKMWTRIG